MGQSVIRNPRKIHSQSGGDPSLPTRVTNLENNEYKVTYYEIISGASGSITIPTGATINAGEFGLSGNCILSKIDGSNKPTFESPKTSGGTIVTASLNETTGAWVASGIYTDSSVALIYSIKIKAVYYSNLTYNNIIETVELTDFPISQSITNGITNKTPSEDAVFDALALKENAFSKNTGFNLSLGTTTGTVLEGDRIVQTITNGDTTHAPSGDVVFDMFKNHRQIYSSIRITQDSATITGTTSETLLASTLVPANTFSVDDVINLEIRCKRASATGATSHRIKINTSNSLSGATLAGIVTNNNAVLMPTFSRNLCIKSSTYTEVMGTSASFSTDVGSITSAISSINIDWTINQYIIISVQPSASAETNVLSYLLIERK